MTLEECTALLTPLAVAMRADVDQPTFRAYHRVLRDVPALLLDQTLTEIAREGLRFFPTAPELRSATEKTRRRLLALAPYDGCPECEGHIGYRRVLIEGQQPTVERCPCKARYLEQLARRGLREPIAALPGEVERENEQVYPTVAQLPADLRRRLTDVAARKAIS